MPNTAERHYMKVYLQDRFQQPTKHICKCMVHIEFNYVIFTNDKGYIY